MSIAGASACNVSELLRLLDRLTGVRREQGQQLVENTTTRRSYVLARSELVVDCDDPMVDRSDLRGVLSDVPD